jgi:SseB protein N-terminal domain
MTDPRFAGKPLPHSRFSGDHGHLDATLAAVLTEHAAGRAGLREVQNALVGTRMLIPTAAGLDESDTDVATGLMVEKNSHLAVATFASNAGWVGLLAFTCMDSVRLWDPQARPVPVTAEEAALSALDDGRSVLVVDFAGPARLALTGSLLRALAQGRAAVAPHLDPEVLAAVAERTADVPGLGAARVVDADSLGDRGEDAGDAVVALRVLPGSDAAEVARRVAEELAQDPILRDRCEGGFAIGIEGLHV